MILEGLSTGPGCGDASGGSRRERPVRRGPAPTLLPLLAGIAAIATAALHPGEARAQGVDRVLLDPAMVWSRVAVTRVGEGKDARPVVVLARPIGAEAIPDTSQPIRLDMVPRELVRQALLIAARDELGAATRDEVIGDPATAAGKDGGSSVELGSIIRENRSHEVVRRVDPRKIETIFSHETPTAPGRHLDWIKLIAAAEELSRKSFPGVLKGMGLDGKPNAVKDAAGLPARVEERLEALGFLEALLAVRDVHRAIRADGESPARLGALARGYALLGVLSEHEWHPAHRAYKARALLYAQRMVARDPDHPRGLWHRAFALTLVGRHGDAVEDLKAAREKAARKNGIEVPDWVEVIDAAARFDAGRLGRPQGRHARLTTFLRMMALAYPRSKAVGVNAARAMVVQQPHCFLAHDLMSSYHGVSTLHLTTMLGPQALEHFLTVGLPESDGLPRGLKDALAEQPGLVRAVELLEKAGAADRDAGEPSWAALGHMIRETRFVQVFRRVHFMRVMWSVPVDQYWNEVLLDVADHRYRPYLENLALPTRESADAFARFAEKLDLTEIEPSETEMNRALWNLESQRAKAAWAMAVAHADETAELAAVVADAQDANMPGAARDLLALSPYHVYARATLVAHDWENAKDKFADWQKESGDWPVFLAAMGLHYTGTREFDAARRALEGYIQLSPDAWAYEQLAANFKAEGKDDRWKETLDAFLTNVEDLGLDHARIRVQLAEHFMALKQWEKARPYAEAAGETWAEWAINCAARCAEGEKDWGRAETWYSRVTERYTNNWAVWYFFCKRTGQGNLDAARESVDRYIAANANNTNINGELFFAYFYWLDGRTDKAKEIFLRAYRQTGSVSPAVAMAMILDDAKDAAGRNELIDHVARHKDQFPKTGDICQLLLETVLAPEGKGKPLDLAAIERILAGIHEGGRSDMKFFVGWFLKNHGHAAEARKYLEDCYHSERSFTWYRMLAHDALKRMGPK